MSKNDEEHDGPFSEISRSLDRRWRAQIISLISVIKTIDFCSLDHDPTVWMRPARLHHDRYKTLNFGTCLDRDPVVRAPRDRRPSIDRPRDPTPVLAPRRLQGK